MTFNRDGVSFYDGDWVNNVRHGFGVRQYASGNIYEGMWFNNMRHGEGTMQWIDQNQMYSGQWESEIQVKAEFLVLEVSFVWSIYHTQGYNVETFSTVLVNTSGFCLALVRRNIR